MIRRVSWALFFVASFCACAGPARVGPTAAAPRACPEAPPFPIRTRVSGDGETTLVLVHGNFDRIESWDAITPHLASSFRVVAIELLGYGETPNPTGPLTLDALAHGVLLAMDAAGVERAVLVGNSLGGAVVARVATLRPDRVDALVLEDANYHPGAGSSHEVLSALFDLGSAATAWAGEPEDDALAARTREAVAAALPLVLPTPGAATPELVDHFTRGVDPAHWPTIQASLVRFDALPSQLVRATRARPIPILIVWGMRDGLLTVGGAEVQRETLPGARLVLIEGCGHAPHLERPALLASILEDAFGPGGRSPSDDRYVSEAGEEPTLPLIAGEEPYVERAVLRARAGDPDALARLAYVELLTGELDRAEAAARRIEGDAPPLALFVRGALREARGEEGAEPLYLAALERWPADQPNLPALRLARRVLDDAGAQRLDAALSTPPSSRTGPIRFAHELARIDRLLAQHRYLDALAEPILSTMPYAPAGYAISLRRMSALYGAGRVDGPLRHDHADFVIPSGGEDWRPGGLVRSGAYECAAWWRQRALGLWGDFSSSDPVVGCEDASRPERAFSWAPLAPLPPLPSVVSAASASDAERDLAPYASDPHVALALAQRSLRGGDRDHALALLRAVPPSEVEQFLAFHRLALPLRAWARDRAALTEARALVRRWPHDAVAQEILGATLHAAGRARDARAPLEEALALGGSASARLELAYTEASLGRLDRARALLVGLERRIGSRGMEALYPHLGAAGAALRPSSP